MQGAAVAARRDLAVGRLGLLERQCVGVGDHALQERVVAAQPVEVETGQLDGGDQAPLHEVREPVEGKEGEVLVGSGALRDIVGDLLHGVGAAGACPAVVRPALREAQPQRGRHAVVERHGPQLLVPFEGAGDAVEHHLPLPVVELDPADPLGLLDHRGGELLLPPVGEREHGAAEHGRGDPRRGKRAKQVAAREFPPRTGRGNAVPSCHEGPPSRNILVRGSYPGRPG